MAATLAATALLTACAPPLPGSENDPFRDYYQVNLLDSWQVPGLDEWTETLVGAGSGIPAGGGHSYISATPTAQGYRLEIPNLMPDGDFAATGLNPHWTVDGAGPPTANADSSTADEAIDGESLFITGNGFLAFDLRAGLADLFVAGAAYEVRLRYNRAQTIFNAFDYGDGTGSRFGAGPFEDSDPQTPVDWEVYTLPSAPDFGATVLPPFRIAATNDGSPHEFVIGSRTQPGATLDSYIDDIRVIRTDIFPVLATQINVGELPEDSPPAYPGEYVLVLDALPADTTPTVPNSFPAEYLSAWSSTADSSPLSGWQTDSVTLSDVDGYGTGTVPIILRLDLSDISIGADGPEGVITIGLSPDIRAASGLMSRSLGAIELRNARLYLDAWGTQVTDADFATWD